MTDNKTFVQELNFKLRYSPNKNETYRSNNTMTTGISLPTLKMLTCIYAFELGIGYHIVG